MRAFACERCSRRKQKCDRLLPSCSLCRETGVECVASAKENSMIHLNDSDNARKGYVTLLQERIAALEEELLRKEEDSRPGHDGPTMEAGPGSEPVARQGSSSQQDSNTAQAPAGSAPQLTNPEAYAEQVNIDALPLSAMAEPRSRAGEFLKQLSISRIIVGMTETYGGNPEATTRSDSLWGSIAKYIRLPDGRGHRIHIQPDEAERALETYLEAVDFRFPRIPVSKVRSGIVAIVSSDDAEYRKKLSSDPAHVFMAYMVIAIVPLVSENYPVSQGSFVSLHILALCLKILDSLFTRDDGVDIIQCLHLLVIFSIHCSAAGSAWHLIGFTMNKCVALGYHRNMHAATAQTHSTDEQEQRRWAFWGCYTLDRLISSALGRPFAIDDSDVVVSLPKVNPDNGPTAHRESFDIHLFKYAQLISSVASANGLSDCDSLRGNLLHWRASTPPRTGPLVRQPYLQQTSLFNTLLLRIAIRDCVSHYDFVDTTSGQVNVRYRVQDRQPCDIIAAERTGIHRLKLSDICCAVCRSLDRRLMTGRHYLSLTTGYSAFLMALATLYIQVCTEGNTQSMGFGSQVDEYGAWNVFGTPSRSVLGGQQDDSRQLSVSDVLEKATQKLDVVGRQFPRMQEYRLIVQDLSKIITHGPSLVSPISYCEHLAKVAVRAMDIGPLYLQRLAQAILFLVEQRHPQAAPPQL